jgi:hypothetical protein
MLKVFLFVFCIICLANSKVHFDFVKSLVSYSTYEHALVKEEIENRGMQFSWKFCPFGKFPIEKGRASYFAGVNKDISYVAQVEDKYYVGVTFRFDSDTIYYKIITYKAIVSQDTLLTWERLNDYIDITVDQNGKIISQ